MANKYVSSIAADAAFALKSNVAAGFTADGSGTTGWSGYTGASTSVPGAISATGGKLRVTNSTAAAHRGSASMTGLTSGKVYKVTYEITAPGTNGGNVRVSATQTASSGTPSRTHPTSASPVTASLYFIATATTMYFIASVAATSAAAYIDLDDIVLKEGEDGSNWTNAFPSLETLLTAGATNILAAGDTCYIASDHVEAVAFASTYLFPGTAASPCRFISVNRAGSVPPVAADMVSGAQIDIEVNGAITLNGVSGSSNYFYGITFFPGSSSTGSAAVVLVGTSAATTFWHFKKCHFKRTTSSASSNAFVFGPTVTNNYSRFVLDETSFEFNATGDGISIRITQFEWSNTPNAIVGTTLPTSLFSQSNGAATTYSIENVDLSALGSGKSITSGGTVNSRFVLKDCKLGAGVSLVPLTFAGPHGTRVDAINCDDGDTNYRHERHDYNGSGTTETVITRSGGAIHSRKIATSAGVMPFHPYASIPIQFWNTTVGSAITVTIEGVWDNASVPDNDDIWLEAAYLGTSGSTLSSLVSDGLATLLSTAAAQTSSSEAWTTTGLATPTKFKLGVTFTPQEAGPVTLTVKAALPSATFYIDPIPVVT